MARVLAGVMGGRRAGGAWRRRGCAEPSQPVRAVKCGRSRSLALSREIPLSEREIQVFLRPGYTLNLSACVQPFLSGTNPVPLGARVTVCAERAGSLERLPVRVFGVHGAPWQFSSS